MFAEVIPENETEERELWQAALELYPEIRRKHGLACEFVPGKGINLYGPVEHGLLQPASLTEQTLEDEAEGPWWACGPQDRMAIRAEIGWVLEEPFDVTFSAEDFLATTRVPAPAPIAGNTLVLTSVAGAPKQEKLALASCGVRILKHARIQGTVSVHLAAAP